MVDVAGKQVTLRRARASGLVRMQPGTLALIQSHQLTKGNVLEVARVAGIMAAKRTDQTIPLCHTVPLTSVQLDFQVAEPNSVRIEALAETVDRTGVEMEALLAVSVAALTIYDMCKSVDRGMTIELIRLEEKSGGLSGHFEAQGVP
jgi:cyclic pyranopterin phosphate synthase